MGMYIDFNTNYSTNMKGGFSMVNNTYWLDQGETAGKKFLRFFAGTFRCFGKLIFPIFAANYIIFN